MTTLLSPGWGKGRPADGAYWTRKRIVQALRQYAEETPGPLPVDDHEWNRLKVGRLDIPTAQPILNIWHSMARAWLAVGVERDRVPRLNTRWTRSEINFLLEHAGEDTLEEIAVRLKRSYAAVRTKLGAKGFGIKARENQGWLSIARASREYGLTKYELAKAIESRKLSAVYHDKGHRWRIDPADLERVFGRPL